MLKFMKSSKVVDNNAKKKKARDISYEISGELALTFEGVQKS